MFQLADDNVRIIDSQGRVVGFIFRGKFTQINPEDMETNGGWCDRPYNEGLSPYELELVAEIMPVKKGPRHG